MKLRKGHLRRTAALAAAALAIAAAPASASIVADSGFRPQPNGFSFQNYGSGYAGLDATDMQRIFGRKACVAGKGSKCVLRPAVRMSMESVNESMSGGHCFGMAVVAGAIHRQLLPQFGISSMIELGAPAANADAWDIPFQGNTAAQKAIARAFYLQALPVRSQSTIKGKPSRIIEVLRKELKHNSPESWFVTITDPASGGHAVNAYAIDDLGGGKYDILVYDNNWPGMERRIHVDTNAETWSYNLAGGEVEDVIWQGDAKSQTLEALPVRPFLGVQPCEICVGREGMGSKYNTITLDAAGVDHAHLILRDDKGRRTGIIGGKVVNQIPGVRVVRRAGMRLLSSSDEDKAYLSSVEPLYRVPRGMRVRITVDGRHLRGQELQSLSVVGPTFDASVDTLLLAPGEQASLVLSPARGLLSYRPSRSTKSAAASFSAVSVPRKGKGEPAAYDINITAKGLPRGARTVFRKYPKKGLLRFGHTGTKSARVSYQVTVTEFSTKGKTVRTRLFRLAGRKRAAFFYYKALGKIGNPRIVVISDRGKRMAGKKASQAAN